MAQTEEQTLAVRRHIHHVRIHAEHGVVVVENRTLKLELVLQIILHVREAVHTPKVQAVHQFVLGRVVIGVFVSLAGYKLEPAVLQIIHVQKRRRQP